jgi:hypothetical protein
MKKINTVKADELPLAGGDDEPVAELSDLQLWVKARDACEKKLGRLPSNEDMVDFAKSKDGKSIRHMFPFDDLQRSARKHWIYLAGCYTRQATIIFASDPKKQPTRVRALHVVKGSDGRKGIATLAQVVNTKDYSIQVLEEARASMLTFQAKYEQLLQVIKNRSVKAKLSAALTHVTKAAKALQ